MAWRFRKRISFGKFLRFNLSKTGVSTTIGVKGASINIGKKGVYRNLGIPGTGIYRRDKIGDAPSHDANLQNVTEQNLSQQGKGNTNLIVVLIIVAIFVLFVVGSIIRTVFNF
jgi:hypothetical protein